MTNPNYQQYPQGPQYPPGYGQPQQYPQGQPQQNGQPLQQGSLSSYWAQPSTGGGPALKFETNTTHVGIVSRKVTDADVQQQTLPGSNTPATFKDGSPKWVLKIPLTVQKSPGYPDGIAQWYCSGGARDELVRAMVEAGAPAGPPEYGAMVTITCTGTRPSGPGMNPAKVYRVEYVRPDNPQAAASVPDNVVAFNSNSPSAAQGNDPAAPRPPDDLDADQQELMRRLVGQAAG